MRVWRGREPRRWGVEGESPAGGVHQVGISIGDAIYAVGIRASEEVPQNESPLVEGVQVEIPAGEAVQVHPTP